MLQINQSLIEIIKRFEGLKLKAYDDLQPDVEITDKSQVKGKLTIGYGHTKNVKVGQTITENQANDLLIQDLQPYAKTVLQNVEQPLNINMFNALVSFCYNVGQTAFRNSQVLKSLNENKHSETTEIWKDSFITANGKVVQGLVNRRFSESELFWKDRFVLEMFIPDVGISLKKNANWFTPLGIFVLIIVLFNFK